MIVNEKITKKIAVSKKSQPKAKKISKYKSIIIPGAFVDPKKEDLLNYSEIDEAAATAKRQQEGAAIRAEAKGLQKGMQKKAVETAINFLNMGMSVEVVAQGTGLTIEQVKDLKNKL